MVYMLVCSGHFFFILALITACVSLFFWYGWFDKQLSIETAAAAVVKCLLEKISSLEDRFYLLVKNNWPVEQNLWIFLTPHDFGA